MDDEVEGRPTSRWAAMMGNNYNKHGVRHFDDHEEAPYIRQSLGIKDPRKWDSRRRFSGIDMMSMEGGGDRKHGNKRASVVRDGVQHYSIRPVASGAGVGGEDPASSTVVQSLGSECADQSLAVDSFFASIRVPASFIAATSFTELFGMYNGKEDKNSTEVQRFLQGLCLACQGFTFILSLNVIMISTSALTRGLTGNFDPYAENGYELLFREFHYEFVVTRWSFQVAMFAFLLAVVSQVLYEFELFNVNGENYQRHHLEIGIAVVLIMTALFLHLLSYLNSTLIGWENMIDMTIDLLRMLWNRGSGWKYPLEPIALVIFFVGLFFLILAMIPGSQI